MDGTAFPSRNKTSIPARRRTEGMSSAKLLSLVVTLKFVGLLAIESMPGFLSHVPPASNSLCEKRCDLTTYRARDEEQRTDTKLCRS